MTLRNRLALALAVVATMVLLSGLAIVVLVRASLIDEVDHQLRAAAAMAPSPTVARRLPPIPVSDLHPSEIAEMYLGEVTSGGELHAVFPALPGDGHPPAPVVDAATVAAHAVDHEQVPTAFDAPDADGVTSYRMVAVRFDDGGTAVIGLSTARIDATFRRVQIGMVAAGSLILASFALATWWVERLGLRPIRSVTETAGAIAGGDLDRRVPVPPAGTEAGHLARAFNVMLDERQAWERQLRRFVADASHELRTPLTTVLGVMELHRNGSLPVDQLDDALGRAHDEARRMADLVADLLLLAHLDQGRPLADDPVDLGRLALDAALDARLARPDRRITTAVSPVPVLRGDESRLRQVVTNLVANALTHAGDGASVQLLVRSAEPGERGPTGVAACVLEVRDDGPGMTAEQAAHVFERFYRVDAGRARRRGGSGLGLSIVRSIVAAHAGQVSVRTAPGRGAAFQVVLPVAGRHFQPTSRLFCPPVETGAAGSDREPAPVHDRGAAWTV